MKNASQSVGRQVVPQRHCLVEPARKPHQANLRVAASAETARQLLSDLDLVRAVDGRADQSLRTHGSVACGAELDAQLRCSCGVAHEQRVCIRAPCPQRRAPIQLTCESVFTIQNSTPSSSLMIIRLTALEPPPPTPMTCVHRTITR